MADRTDFHQSDCHPDGTCIDCGGCECGAVGSSCVAYCWTSEDELQYRTESGGGDG